MTIDGFHRRKTRRQQGNFAGAREDLLRTCKIAPSEWPLQRKDLVILEGLE